MKIEKELQSMVGKTYLYNTRELRVDNYRIKDDLVIVATDKEIFTWSLDDAGNHIRDFMPVDNEGVTARDLVVMPDKKQLNNLKAVIMDNIDKVKQDRNYVQQANAVNKSIGTLINVANLELQYMKMLKK